MWSFLAREANWTEIVTNTLALGFSMMAIVVIAYAVLFNPDILATVGSVTSGITGVILGYYFNRERLRRAQLQASTATQERRQTAELASISEERLAAMSEDFKDIVIQLEQYLANQESGEE